MYGPRPDPRQQIIPSGILDEPLAYGLCLIAGILLTILAWWRRPPEAARALCFVTGQAVILTAPMAALIDRYVYGSYPTIDKEGSLLFYMDGVHVRMLTDPIGSLEDSAAALIGVHVGHLWVSQGLDLFLSPLGAFNAQGLLYIVLGWFCAWGLLRAVSGDPRTAMLLAFPYGMGLHIFRDLNWYTIEKAAIFGVPLYMWAMLVAARRGGWAMLAPPLCFAVLCWLNLYLGLVCGAFAATVVGLLAANAVYRKHAGATLWRTTTAAGASLAAAMPLLLWQSALMDGGHQLASPEEFLWLRAALDSFTLFPLRWNRLEIWAALHPLAMAIVIIGAVSMRKDPRVQLALVTAAALAMLALGPAIVPDEPGQLGAIVVNPVYMAAKEIVPGFWRVAKPEVFFHASWALGLAVAARWLAAQKPSDQTIAALYILFLGTWIAVVRTHPTYPPLTMPVQSTLAPGWHEQVFQH